MDDRHARHRRRPADARRRPPAGFRARDRRRFDRSLHDALRTLPGPILEHLRRVEILVAELPPLSDDPLEPPIRFSSYHELPARSRRRTRSTATSRLVVYRRPIEARARDKADLIALLRDAVLHEVAHQLGIDDDGIDERGWH